MFKQRIVTGIILVVIVLLLIMFSPMWLFLFLSTLTFLFAAWEWSRLIKLQHVLLRALFVLLVALVMLSVLYVNIQIVLWVAVLWWLFAFIWVWLYPVGVSLWAHSIWVRSCMGILVLVPCWLAINMIRGAENGIGVLLFLLFVIWGADTGAYLVGKWKGKHQLMARVSPKKTWEGFIGGIILSLLVAFIGANLLQIASNLWPKILLLSFVFVLFSVNGDLFESMLKRQSGLKDSGGYLPGHGGLLDRIDSLTAAAPVFLLGCLLLGLISF